MNDLINQSPLLATFAMFGIGLITGWPLAVWSERLVTRFQATAGADAADGTAAGDEHVAIAHPPRWWTAVGTGTLFASYFACVYVAGAHRTPDVLPDPEWVYGRGIGHLVLIALLVVATVTDLRDFIIPDQITVPGMLCGVLLATASGDTQLMHVWIDWNAEVPGLRGPEIPAWIGEHRHWHGLTWSMAGLLAGGGLTWVLREVSSRLLGYESMGLGDVTLMAMIGTFTGWQPVLFVLLFAPLTGLLAGLVVRFATNRSYLPYGPWLSLATIIVLLSWRWLWLLESGAEFSLRKLFGDPIGLAIMAGIALGGLITMLLALRLYRLIPGRVRDVL